jgi:tRNA (Thr-GGU) A37 N-methylase
MRLGVNSPIVLKAVAMVRGGRSEPIDDEWDGVHARIELNHDQFTDGATDGLAAFSHVEVVFVFDRVEDREIETGSRHPRGRRDWPSVGIFAQRGKGRPNRIGVTICALEGVDGLTLRVRGLDAIDGTPVLDIKPVMKGFLPRGEIREPQWATDIMQDYW